MLPPVAVAVTVYMPGVALAVNVGAVARPLASVVTMTGVRLTGNVPLGPLPGALKVTETPGTVLPYWSLAVTVTLWDAPAAVGEVNPAIASVLAPAALTVIPLCVPVIVAVTVTADGHVSDSKIFKSSGDETIDAAVARAAEHSTYKPEI